MKQLYTTLNKIRACSPCRSGWGKLLANLGKTHADDEQLPFANILASNGLDDTIWCLRSTPEYSREARLFMVWCASQVKHLMRDPCSLAALDVAERYANGMASDTDLEAAGAAAEAAAWAAGAAAWEAAWEVASKSQRATLQALVEQAFRR